MEGVLSRADEAAADDHWIGPAPSPLQIAALMLIGTVGMEITGVQPVLLGALVTEGRLTSAGLGWASTSEFLCLGATVGLAGAFLKPRRIKLVIVCMSLASLIVDLLVFSEHGLPLVLNRALAGLFEGLLVWPAVCMIARSSTPALWSAIFLTLQTLGQLVFASVLPLTVMRGHGANVGFLVLGLLSLSSLLAAHFSPSSFSDLPASANEKRGSGLLSVPAIASLVSVALIGAFSFGLFAYLPPLGAGAKLSAQTQGLAVSAVLAAQIAGSTLAAVVAKRISYYPVFLVCVLVNAVILAVLASSPGPFLFTAAAAAFGFLWLFFAPFQVPLVIESDPTRRTAVLLAGVQMLGGAAGPLLCSFFVTDTEARGVLVVAGACFLVAFMISTVLHLRHRRARRSPREVLVGQR